MKIFKTVGAIALPADYLHQQRVEKCQAHIPENEILEIRFRIYFGRIFYIFKKFFSGKGRVSDSNFCIDILELKDF